MLKVVHISTTDNQGGSGRSAYRIHKGLRELGLQSRMIVGTRVTDDTDVDVISSGLTRKLDQYADRFTGRLSWQYLFYPSSFSLLRHPWIREANIIQFYNTHGGYFSHTVMPLLSRGRKLVWRLSDMWPMTGHCSYSMDCARWQTGCGECPILSDRPELYRDTTARLWSIKNRVYAKSDLTIVAPSRWMENLARESPLLNRFEIRYIPNGLDIKVFRPLSKSECRRQLGIAEDRPVLLFSAFSMGDKRKGALLVQKALEIIRKSGSIGNLIVILAGAGSESMSSEIPFDVVSLDEIQSDQDLARAYSAADVFVLPTLAENLPNGILESMACGTPVVTFDVGGCVDAVRHLKTGYLAKYSDAVDLADGIRFLVSETDLRIKMGIECRRMIEAEFNSELQAHRFLSLYTQVIETEAANV
jgi:glycosyltransferase involved in cell wall biosynthesis